jgi:protein arginine kinase activator
MKCQHCEKIATFHITELTDPEGPKMVHLCEDHAREFFESGDSVPATKALSDLLSKQLQLEQAVKEIAAIDKKKCPMCGITFSEFRKGGRLGCPYDYVVFEEDLVPLLLNIHGAHEHTGKVPVHGGGNPERQFRLKRLRQELQRAVETEDYEKASKVRDRIRGVEAGELELGGGTDADLVVEYDDSYQTPPDNQSSSGKSKGGKKSGGSKGFGKAGDEDLDDDDLEDDDLDVDHFLDDSLIDEDLEQEDIDDEDLDDEDLDEDDLDGLDDDDLDDDDLDDEGLDDADLDDGLGEDELEDEELNSDDFDESEFDDEEDDSDQEDDQDDDFPGDDHRGGKGDKR